MTALAIAAVGAITAVGEDAPATVGSIYMEAEAFKRLLISGGQPLSGAIVPIDSDLKGTDRLAVLGAAAAKEATQDVPARVAIGLVVCAPADGLACEPGREDSFLTSLADNAGFLVDKQATRLFGESCTTTAEALSFAREILRSRDVAAVCVLGVDSLSTPPRLGKLVRKRSSQGEPFVPGEAAAAVLLTRQLSPGSLAVLAGLGVGLPGSRETPANPAKASLTAIEQALSDAGARRPIAGLVHDLPATQTGGEELAWLQSGRLSAAPGIYVLSPASSTGETGAASGILSLATLTFLIAQREVLGPGACLFASEDGHRGAAVVGPSKHRANRE